MQLIQRHLDQLSKEVAIVHHGEDEVFTITINPDLLITLTYLDPGIRLLSKVVALPKENLEDLLIYVMRANYLGQGTLGGTLALDPSNENLLTLSLAIPYDMNYPEFKETLEDFANIVDYWRDEVTMKKTRPDWMR